MIPEMVERRGKRGCQLDGEGGRGSAFPTDEGYLISRSNEYKPRWRSQFTGSQALDPGC